MTLDLATLPSMDTREPRRSPRPSFADAGIDALLVTHLPNVRYLTGFTGSAAMLLVTPDALVFTSDGRYRTQAAEQLARAGVDAQIEIGATTAAQRDAIGRALATARSASKPTRSRGRSNATWPTRSPATTSSPRTV